MSLFSGVGRYMARSLRILIADDQLRARQSLKAVATTWVQVQADPPEHLLQTLKKMAQSVSD